MSSSKDEATADLGDLIAQLEKCIRSAIAEFIKDHAALRHRYSKRSQASIINDLMIAHVKANFDNSTSVTLHKKNNSTIVALLGGKYKTKLKKLDDRLLASNIRTQAVLSFNGQESFDVVPPPTNLFLGYQILKDAELSASKIWIVCPDGSSVGWALDISGASAPAEAATTEPVNDTAPRKRRVTLRQPQDDEKTSEAGDVAAGDE